MANLFDLDPETLANIQDGLDSLVNVLGKKCRLVYPPKWTTCNNCILDPQNQRSSNHYRHGGPIKFPDGAACPQCNGDGKVATQVSEDVKFLCEWNPSKFFYPIPNLDIRVPFGVIQTKGFIKDWPKVERCDYLVFQVALAGLGERRYKLLGEPGDRSNIVQERYFVATWQRSK